MSMDWYESVLIASGLCGMHILQNPEHCILEINMLPGWRLGELEGGSWGEWINAFLATDGSQWGKPADTSEHMYVLQKLLFH